VAAYNTGTRAVVGNNNDNDIIRISRLFLNITISTLRYCDDIIIRLQYYIVTNIITIITILITFVVATF
jgi:hypothetical protein